MTVMGRPPGGRELEAARAVRDAEMYALYSGGTSIAEIAAQYDVSQRLVYKRIEQVAKTSASKRVEEVRTRQASDIEMLYSVLLDRVLAGDLKAVAEYRAVMERESKLFGADAAIKAEVSVSHDLPPEVKAMQEKIEAARKATEERERALTIEGEVSD